MIQSNSIAVLYNFYCHCAYIYILLCHLITSIWMNYIAIVRRFHKWPDIVAIMMCWISDRVFDFQNAFKGFHWLRFLIMRLLHFHRTLWYKHKRMPANFHVVFFLNTQRKYCVKLQSVRHFYEKKRLDLNEKPTMVRCI